MVEERKGKERREGTWGGHTDSVSSFAVAFLLSRVHRGRREKRICFCLDIKLVQQSFAVVMKREMKGVSL